MAANFTYQLTRFAAAFILIGICISVAALEQAIAQNGRPDTEAKSDLSRRHERIQRKEPPGRRAELSTLKGAALFVGTGVNTRRPVPLVVHFHGASWLIEQHMADHLPAAVLVTVQLGAGSSFYGRPFGDEKVFSDLIAEAELLAEAKRGWSSVTLTGFSAGYGAIRAILRHPANFNRVGGVLLLDGFHAGYENPGKKTANEGPVAQRDIDSFVSFARDAAAGRKHFVITHSQIHPGTYASTTECANELLRELGLPRQMSMRQGPMGMRQTSEAGRKNLRVFGYAGETAPDHVDHLHAMPFWFKFLGVR